MICGTGVRRLGSETWQGCEWVELLVVLTIMIIMIMINMIIMLMIYNNYNSIPNSILIYVK